MRWFGQNQHPPPINCAVNTIYYRLYTAQLIGGGCWFCPNQSIEEFASLKINYPYLWEKLKEMSNDNMLISQNFKWGMTFANVEKCVDRHLRNSKNKQLDLFEVIENAN